MVCEATKGIIIYWKPYQPLVIHIYHHVCFDEYNYHLHIEDNYTPGSLLLQQYPESNVHNSDLLNLIPCGIDFKSTTFSDKKFSHIKLSYLPLEGKLVLIYWMMKTL